MDNFLTPETLNKLLMFKLMGGTGGYKSVLPLIDAAPVRYTPDMLNARLGLQGDEFGAAISGNLTRRPDGTYSRQPGPFELSYRTPLFGGVVGANAGIGPRNAYNARLFYEREF